MARAFCLLIIFARLLFGNEEFIFWAKYSSVNGIIKSQNIAISKAMVLNKTGDFLCDIYSVKLKDENTLNYLKRNEEEIFLCFSSQEIILNENSKFGKNNLRTITDITVVPLHFIVDFKPYGARISKTTRLR